MTNINLKTILYVEDQIIISMEQSEIIKSFGYKVITANSGEKALDLFAQSRQIDLVLMDIDLGHGIGGPETARRILEKHDIPILFLTSHAEKEFVERVRKITRYGYVIRNSGDFVLRSSIEMAFELFDARWRLVQKEEALQQHQIELILQNEALSKTRQELDASRARYISLYDLAPVGYFILDENKAITQCNKTAQEQLGIKQGDLTEKFFHQYILPRYQDIFYLFCKKLLETGKNQTCEIQLCHAISGSISVRLEGIVRNTSGNKLECHLVVSQIKEPERYQTDTKGGFLNETTEKRSAKRFAIKKRQRLVCYNSNPGY